MNRILFFISGLLVLPFGISTMAQVRIPAKATVGCQHCDLLKTKANIIEKSIEGKADSSDEVFKAIGDTKKALADFLVSAGDELDEKEMDALLRAWSVVSIHDHYFSIPQAQGIGDKLSDKTFDKIQTTASSEARRYCQAPAPPKKGEAPHPPCSAADSLKKRSLMAISAAIMEMFAEREAPNRENG